MNQIKEPNNDNVYVRDIIEYLAPIKTRLKIMQVLREEFKCEELLVISEKEKEIKNNQEAL